MVKRLLEKKIPSKTLAIFRIAFFSNLLFEVLKLYKFKELIFDKIPYFEAAEISFTYIFWVWIASLLMIIIGFKTKLNLLINYIVALFLISTITTYEYHMFYVYMGISFLTLFIPLSKSHSIDNLLEKINYSTLKKQHVTEEKVPEFYYYIFIFVGIGLFYLDSTFYKLTSEMWLDGLGMWLPSSIPFAVKIDSTLLLNNEFIIKSLSYITIIFELVFIFLFWNKRFKIPFFIIGVIFHIGIYLIWPIPHFALGLISIYLLLLPPNLSEKIKFPKTKKKLLFFYDNECPLCLRTKIVIEHFDLFNSIKFISVQENFIKYPYLEKIGYDNALINIYSINNDKVYKGIDTYIMVFFKMIYTAPLALFLKIPGVYHLAKKAYSIVAANRNTERCSESLCEVGFSTTFKSNINKVKVFNNLSADDFKKLMFRYLFCFIIIAQVFVSLRSPLISQYIRNNKVYAFYDKNLNNVRVFIQTFFGITNHGLFTNSHFNGYNHYFKIEYISNNGSKVILPITNEDGKPGAYLKGFNWTKWTFRVSMPKINQEKLDKGIRDFTAYWLHNNLISGNPSGNHTFLISVKKLDNPKGWEKDFLKNQLKKDWIQAGTVNWHKKKFTTNIVQIESI